MAKYKEPPRVKAEKRSSQLAINRRRQLNDQAAKRQQKSNKKRGW